MGEVKSIQATNYRTGLIEPV